MTETDRRTNETIARACGCTQRMYCWLGPDGVVLSEGHNPPDYIADPARLPEMWALCRKRGFEVVMVGAPLSGNRHDYQWRCSVSMDGSKDGKWTDDPQRAFASALAAALESEEGV